jgi:hypothetical protein
MIVDRQSIHASDNFLLGMSNDIHMNSKNQDCNVGQPTVDGNLHHQQVEASTVAVTDIKEHDILLGRGKSNANHVGNVLFQGKVLMIIVGVAYFLSG